MKNKQLFESDHAFCFDSASQFFLGQRNEKKIRIRQTNEVNKARTSERTTKTMMTTMKLEKEKNEMPNDTSAQQNGFWRIDDGERERE